VINLKKLTNDDIGREVVYTTYSSKEKGILKSWNSKWIFVVYNCADDWENYQDYTAAATDPNDLDFIS